jgi:hypothetical protein
MRVNKYLLPILMAVALLGSVGVAQATGAWEVSGKQEISLGVLTSSEEVRGWMTLQQVADGFGLTFEDLHARLNLPPDLPSETALKELEGLIPGFETTTVREVIAVYLGESVAPEATVEPTVTPGPTPTPEAIVTEHTGPTPLPAGAVLAASEIKGRHTLLEVAGQCQVPLDALLAALNLPADADPNVELKDLAAAGTIESVEIVKDVVLQLQTP